MKIRIGTTIGLLALTAALPAFQNCSRGFKSANSKTSSSTGAALGLPTISFATAPPALSSSRNLQLRLSFTVDRAATASSITCQFNNEPAVDCSSLTWNLTNIADGDHTLILRAQDSQGQNAEKRANIRVDATAPTITVSQKPADITGATSAMFDFAANDALSGVKLVECAVDAGAFAACTSPVNMNGVTSGAHTFRIRATDAAGMVSAITTLNWTVDLTAPALTISSKPNNFTNSKTANFTFSATSTGSAIAGYECALNSTTFAACTSPATYTALNDGAQIFRVRARTAAGVTSAATTVNWTVDTVAPTAPVLTANVGSETKSTSASISLMSTDAASSIASYQCSLDNAAFTGCTSPVMLQNLTEGTHSLSARAIDIAGNMSAAAQFTWRIDLTPVPLDGAMLYATNCAGCHMPLASSSKIGRTSMQITDAINIQPAMAGLKSLTAAEINAIAAALAPATAPGDGTIQNDVAPPLNLNLAAQCGSATVRGSSNASLQKLTKKELLETVKDVFYRVGEFEQIQPYIDYTYIPFASQNPVQTAFNQYPEEFSRKVGEEFERAHNRDQVYAWMDAVDGLTNLAMTTRVYNRFVTNECIDRAPSAACFQEFVTRFGRRAWRRPLTAAEISGIASRITNRDQIQPAMARMLRSPDFVFQARSGAQEESTRVRMTQHEIASLISYTLTSTMPDDALAAAADQGQLSTLAQIQGQVDRLARSAKGRERLWSFFEQWLDLSKLRGVTWAHANFDMVPPYAPPTYFEYRSDNMQEYYKTEARDFVSHILFEGNGNFSDLMTKQISFPKEVKVAHVYGVAQSSNGQPVPTPNHPGLLTRGAFLASEMDFNNPIQRGVKILRKVMCNDIPSPDFSVVAARDVQLANLDPYRIPNHQRVTQTTSSTACMACHSQINAYGFLFENYSPLGRKVTVQNAIIDASRAYQFGQTAPSLPAGVRSYAAFTHQLPGPQTLALEANQSRTFNNSGELIQAIAASNQAKACMNVRMFRYFNRRAETSNDACVINESQTKLTTNQTVLNTIEQFLSSEDVLWRKK